MLFAACSSDRKPPTSRERAQAFLLREQNPNGSWPVFVGDDHDGSWLTSLVAITLRDFVSAIPARLKGLHWLLSNAGKEAQLVLEMEVPHH